MEVTALWQQAALGAVGGASAELLHWYLLARKPEGRAPYRAGAVYWITTLGMVALGGLMPVLYLGGSASALLCFHLGAATPVLLQKLVTTLPAGQAAEPTSLEAAPSVSLRTFFTW